LTGDGQVGLPDVVEVHLDDVVLVHALHAFVHLVLREHITSALVSHELGFGQFTFGHFYSELLADLTGLLIVDAIEEGPDNAEGLGDNATDFSRVVSGCASFDGQVEHADSSQGRGDPELLVVEAATVHAEHGIRAADGLLGQLKQGQQIGRS